MTTYDQQKNQQWNFINISHLPDHQQTDLIAEHFAAVQNEYQPLKEDDIVTNFPKGKRVAQHKRTLGKLGKFV